MTENGQTQTPHLGVQLAEIEMKLEPLLSNSSPLIRQLAWTQLRRIQAIHNKNQEIIEAYAAKQEKEKH